MFLPQIDLFPLRLKDQAGEMHSDKAYHMLKILNVIMKQNNVSMSPGQAEAGFSLHSKKKQTKQTNQKNPKVLSEKEK